MSDDKKVSLTPVFENPKKLNPVLSIARTARELNISYQSREKERIHDQAEKELARLPSLAAPKGPSQP